MGQIKYQNIKYKVQNGSKQVTKIKKVAIQFKKRYQSKDRKCGKKVNGSNQKPKYKIRSSKWVKQVTKIKKSG